MTILWISKKIDTFRTSRWGISCTKYGDARTGPWLYIYIYTWNLNSGTTAWAVLQNYYLYRSFHAYVIRASKRQRHCWVYFIQYTHQQLCRYVVNTTQIYTVHSSAALQLDCVFSLSVNPLHFTGYEPWCSDNKEAVSSSLHPLISRDPATLFRRFYTRLKGLH